MDKALSPKTVDFLNKNGYEAYRVNELIKGEKITDKEIYDYAIENDYYIITADLDFGHLLAYSKSRKPSTIILRLEDQRINNVNSRLLQVLPNIHEELTVGFIIAVEENQIKFRELPVIE
ncbi:MAG: DUF5615 family PIN-like protein [Candidatus Kariarchaeaceae archaeon]